MAEDPQYEQQSSNVIDLRDEVKRKARDHRYNFIMWLSLTFACSSQLEFTACDSIRLYSQRDIHSWFLALIPLCRAWISYSQIAAI